MSERSLERIDGAALVNVVLAAGTGVLLAAALHRFWDCLCWHLWILVFPL